MGSVATQENPNYDSIQAIITANRTSLPEAIFALISRLNTALEIPTGEEELGQVVKKHAWENISEEKKGRGKFHRKAKPGGWREDIIPHQARSVQKTTAPLLREFFGVESDG